MACCEFTCMECRHQWQANTALRCPSCGSTDFYKDYEDRDLPEDEEEQDDNEV